MNNSVRGVNVRSRIQYLHLQLPNGSLSVSGITRTSRKFIYVRWYYKRKIWEEPESDKIFTLPDTKKCNNKKKKKTFMLVVNDNIHFSNKSFACVCHFPYLFNFSYFIIVRKSKLWWKCCLTVQNQQGYQSFNNSYFRPPQTFTFVFTVHIQTLRVSIAHECIFWKTHKNLQFRPKTNVLSESNSKNFVVNYFSL